MALFRCGSGPASGTYKAVIVGGQGDNNMLFLQILDETAEESKSIVGGNVAWNDTMTNFTITRSAGGALSLICNISGELYAFGNDGTKVADVTAGDNIGSNFTYNVNVVYPNMCIYIVELELDLL